MEKKYVMELNLDPKLVKEATEIFESLGLDLETGIRIFLVKVAHEFEFPFEIEKDNDGSFKVSEPVGYLGIPATVTLDEYSYEESNNFFKCKGMDKSNGVNEFLKKVTEYKGIPFNIKKRQFSKELLEALQESEDIASGKIERKKYHNVREMFEDILNEED